jgi:HTH-type transcriptional regulator, sugar sensing transcriptional regulator
MLLHEYLEQLGLNEKEAKVYLANLELGPSPITAIADRAQIKRTTVYEIIKSLKAQKLVSMGVRGKKKLFVATEPGQIKKLLEKKTALLDEILPELKALSKTAKNRPTIQIFEGTEGLFSIYEDVINDKKDMSSFVAFSEAKEDFAQYFDEVFIPARKKHNIFARVISPNTKTSLNRKKTDSKALREIKTIDKKIYPFSIEVAIYGDKTAFISFKENELFGVIIQSKEITKTMKFLFEFFWNNVK